MKKLFTNDRFFEAVLILIVLSGIFCLNVGLIFTESDLNICLTTLFTILCVVGLYVSYKEHSKNVMKGLMGALLTIGVMDAISRVGTYTATFDKVCNILFLLLALFLFVNHFVINSDHHSSPVSIRLNQIAAIAILVLISVWIIFELNQYNDIWYIALQLVYIIYLFGVISFIVCVESRLDSFRINREEAGWTEEKGYPKNYVHESEIKKDE